MESKKTVKQILQELKLNNERLGKKILEISNADVIEWQDNNCELITALADVLGINLDDKLAEKDKENGFELDGETVYKELNKQLFKFCQQSINELLKGNYDSNKSIY